MKRERREEKKRGNSKERGKENKNSLEIKLFD